MVEEKELNTFDVLVEALHGDYFKAFQLCEFFRGQTIKFPVKQQHHYVAERMLRAGISQREVERAVHLGKSTLYNIMNKIAGGK